MQHSHYHFITKLSEALLQSWQGAILEKAITLSKHEAHIYVRLPSGHYFNMQMQVQFGKCFCFFNSIVPLKLPNAQPLFESIWGNEIFGVRQHAFNRSFEIEFATQKLVFKMYDGLANIILYDSQQKVEELFRDEINNDKLLAYSEFENVDEERKKDLANSPVGDGKFYLLKHQTDTLPVQILLHFAHEAKSYTDIFEVYNEFSRQNLSILHLHKTKREVLQSLKAKLNAANKHLQAALSQVEREQREITPEEIGHIIMANLQTIKQGQETADLLNFYTNERITIKLKKDLSPQENAAWYYRKQKNRKRESQEIQKRIDQLYHTIKTLQESISHVQHHINDIKALRPYIKTQQIEKQKPPFRIFEYDGYTIYVGKGAANNDLLTLRYANKNDLWLHAKDVSGSHVVVKQKGGQFSSEVIAYAASLAAYYSKLKGSAMVPVSYTYKKYVRKPKGIEPGQILVDKEDIIIIEPQSPH
jgi:predicted ribosome quality control (RQC) complex YloA/Tae2 family protein